VWARGCRTLDSPFMTENAAGMMADKVVASQFEHQVSRLKTYTTRVLGVSYVSWVLLF